MSCNIQTDLFLSQLNVIYLQNINLFYVDIPLSFHLAVVVKKSV